MRVISGTARGTKLNSIENKSTRPTLDRVKEALFNILQTQIKEAQVLDLFAGSGALGIESLSRGANFCVFCDKSIEDIKMLKQNLEKTKFQEKAEILVKDYKKCIEQLKTRKFNIIFIDPPYKQNIAVDALKRIVENKMLSEGATIIIETDDEEREKKQIENLQIEQQLEIKNVRKYGRVALIFLHERG